MNTTFYRNLDKIFFSRQTAIIMYHGFTDREIQLENYHGKHLHVKTFRNQLQHLKDHYSIISLKTFINHCLFKTPVPKNSVVLTFDDGYESNFIFAYPALKEIEAPATIFLTTDFIEQKQFIWPNRVEFAILLTRKTSLQLSLKNEELLFDLSHVGAKMKAVDELKTLLKTFDSRLRNELVDTIEQTLEQRITFSSSTPAIHRPLSWQQIREMSESRLIDFGGHTCSHDNLALCAPEMIDKQIAVSKKLIEEKINTPCSLFCYPYGGKESFNELTKRCLQKTGYVAALTTVTGTNNTDSDLFTLRRLGTSNLAGIDNFEAKLLKSRRLLHRLCKKFC